MQNASTHTQRKIFFSLLPSQHQPIAIWLMLRTIQTFASTRQSFIASTTDFSAGIRGRKLTTLTDNNKHTQRKQQLINRAFPKSTTTMKSTPPARSSSTPTVIICPGNGCSNIRESNWYGELYDLLREREIPCVCEDFPDPLHARRNRWIPFMRSLVEKHCKDSNDDDDNNKSNVILVGHSSGAQAALRYAEEYPVYACVLVSATYSDLGDAHERASGYYPQKRVSKSSSSGNGDGGNVMEETNPYEFDKMKANCKNWIQFHSDNDPFIPLFEAEKIRDGLGLTTTYHMLPGRSHFFEFSDEILDSILSLC